MDGMTQDAGAGAGAFLDDIEGAFRSVTEVIIHSRTASVGEVNGALKLLDDIIKDDSFDDNTIIEARLKRVILFANLRSYLGINIDINLAKADIAAVDAAYNNLLGGTLSYDYPNWFQYKMLFYGRFNLGDELLSSLDSKISAIHDRGVVSIYRDKYTACSYFNRHLPGAMAAAFIYVFEEDEFELNWIICELKKARGEVIEDHDDLLYEPLNLVSFVNECNAALSSMTADLDEIKAIRMIALYKMGRYAEAMTDFTVLRDMPTAMDNPFVFNTIGAQIQEGLYYSGVLGLFRRCCPRRSAVAYEELHND